MIETILRLDVAEMFCWWFRISRSGSGITFALSHCWQYSTAVSSCRCVHMCILVSDASVLQCAVVEGKVQCLSAFSPLVCLFSTHDASHPSFKCVSCYSL